MELTSSVNEQRSSTESFNGVERDRGGADVDEGSDQRDEERVVDCSKTLEERGTEVEDEVDTWLSAWSLRNGGRALANGDRQS
jgi:hypothetical protein